MNKCRLLGSTAFVFFFSGFSAFADVTPEEVWGNWKASAAQSGSSFTTESEAREGDTLVITGLSTLAAADPAVEAEGKIDEVRLRDLGDGTVEITMSYSYSMSVVTPAAEGIEPPVAQSVIISVKAPGAVTIASGTPEAVSYVFDIPALDATMQADPEGADPVDIQFSAVNTTGSYLIEDGEVMSSSGDIAAESFSFALKGKDSLAGQDIDMTAAIGAIAGTFSATLLEPALMEDMGAALTAGFAFNFDTSYGATLFTVNLVEATGPTMISGGVESGKLTVGMDSTAFTYQTGSKGLNLAISSPDIPFPEVKLALSESGFGLSMPTTPTGAPAPFSFLAKLVDLTISDEIWGMLDPAGALPHDPASIILDGKGMATLTTNLFAAEAMESGAPPGDLVSFDLVQLLARVAGAELTGTGAFTFDNTDLETFGGVPAPTGKIDLKVTGANTLMDTLISMGLLSEEDAMGARMMMSMFANPGAGEDEFTSVLEFKDKGFYANGQRLQ
jgi:hypothetical protein